MCAKSFFSKDLIRPQKFVYQIGYVGFIGLMFCQTVWANIPINIYIYFYLTKCILKHVFLNVLHAQAVRVDSYLEEGHVRSSRWHMGAWYEAVTAALMSTQLRSCGWPQGTGDFWGTLEWLLEVYRHWPEQACRRQWRPLFEKSCSSNLWPMTSCRPNPQTPHPVPKHMQFPWQSWPLTSLGHLHLVSIK